MVQILVSKFVMNNMENSEQFKKKSRLRGENWTQQEREWFLEIVRPSASIIDNKETNTDSNKMKNLEWHKIRKKLKERTGKYRDIQQLKGFWRRTKRLMKINVSDPNWPQTLEQNTAHTNFIVEINPLDSNAGLEHSESETESSLIHNMDLDASEFHDTESEHSIITNGLSISNDTSERHPRRHNGQRPNHIIESVFEKLSDIRNNIMHNEGRKDDEYEAFGKYIAASLRNMPRKYYLAAKMQMQQSLSNIELEIEEQRQKAELTVQSSLQFTSNIKTEQTFN